LLRALRAGEHPRIHPGLAVITLGTGDDLTTLRAYESGYGTEGQRFESSRARYKPQESRGFLLAG
jgi:hypothetical protein